MSQDVQKMLSAVIVAFSHPMAHVFIWISVVMANTTVMIDQMN